MAANIVSSIKRLGFTPLRVIKLSETMKIEVLCENDDVAQIKDCFGNSYITHQLHENMVTFEISYE